IQLAESDEEKTAFYTGQGVYCYTKMYFGLKNAGTTCQRLVDKAFDSQIGPNIEVYVDDLVVKSHTEAEMLRDKSHTEAEMLRDIDETFHKLRKINMKLNPQKCTFGAVEEVFLGYVVTPEGIKSCPDKTTAVLQLPAISAVLMTERGAIQKPVYFISRALHGPELNYTPMEKLVLSLLFTAKRLQRYFQAHPIAVITDQPIKQIISHPDVAGRLQNGASC
nr:reverse transcriptase domain-containing protein [Tanacetum cinerariifolium]